MQKIYGNTLPLQLFRRQKSHGVLLCGEKGFGKRTLARAMAQGLLCENPGSDGAPCGVCRGCRMMQRGTHPDFITPPRTGKTQIYTAATIRGVVRSLATPPNEGRAKCYLLSDCDDLDPRTQNLLLKSLEEPPAYAYFFLTAREGDALLPTVRSRLTQYVLPPLPESTCREALLERGYTAADADDAVAAFHGNLGACIDYLENDATKKIILLTKKAADAIIERNEYALLYYADQAAGGGKGSDSGSIRLFLTSLDRLIRDAMAEKYDPNCEKISCDSALSSRFSGSLSLSAGQNMHKTISQTFEALDANVNPRLAMAALCAGLMAANWESADPHGRQSPDKTAPLRRRQNAPPGV